MRTLALGGLILRSRIDIRRDDSASSITRHLDVSEDGSSVVAHWQYALVNRVTSQLSRVGGRLAEERRATSENSVTQFAVQNPPPNPHDPDLKGRLSTTASALHSVTSTFNTTTAETTNHQHNTPNNHNNHSKQRNHGCPRSIRKLQRVSGFLPRLHRGSLQRNCILIAVAPNRVGVFATLTNSYALVAVGASENFYR